MIKNVVQDYDDEFKIIIVGSSGVGKSAILLRFADDIFDNSSLHPTIGVDFRFKTLNVEGKNIKIQIWDTAGQETFRTIVSAYYKGADAIIVTYDYSNIHSFTDIEEFWGEEIKQNMEEDCVVMLLGNKCDLEGKPPNQVRINALKQRLNTNLHFEVSAKENEKINLAFTEICKELIKRKRNKVRRNQNRLSFSKDSEAQNPKKKCCQ